jgi:hypothetical protein
MRRKINQKTKINMDVKQLIEKLKTMPEDAPIWVESNEDPSIPEKVQLIATEEEEHYSKTDKPSKRGETFPYVMIG